MPVLIRRAGVRFGTETGLDRDEQTSSERGKQVGSRVYEGEKNGRKVPANRKPRYCPKCGETMIKSGVRKRQEWRCRECKLRTQYPMMEKPSVEYVRAAQIVQDRYFLVLRNKG